MKQPTVLFLTTSYPSPDQPAGGIFVREHALAAATSCSVGLVDLDRSASTRGLYDLQPLPDERFPAWRARYRRFSRPVSYSAFALGAIAGFNRFRREHADPDVLHANSFLSACAALICGARFRKPVVYTEHATIFIAENPGRLSRGMQRLARLALERSAFVLPVSADLRTSLAALAPSARFRVVPNAVDTELFSPGRGRGANDPPRLLTVGLLDTERKGLDILLEAMAHVRETDRAFHLDVVGEGGLRPEYEALAGRLGLDPSVTFHGFRPKDEVAGLMRKADVFVLGSRFENNPCVVIEAMATGLPVVAPQVGGLAELVDHESGRLARPRDPHDLGDKIGAVLDGLHRFDGATISARAAERFGHAAIGRALRDVYLQAISDTKRASAARA